MLSNAEALTREYDLLPSGTTVLCAVSGGADSMCLLHWLSRRKDITLHAAHFDHRLRGEASAADAALVQSTCASWGVPFHLGWADVGEEARRRGQGVEETARQLRYDFLERTAESLGAAVIATAHTADDNAETILLNLLRGTGLKGLCGIPVVRAAGPPGPGGIKLVRPLLTTTRAEILAYLETHGIDHREDASNADETYTRNRLRRQVMPVLKELNPRALDRMGSAARQLRELDAWLDGEAEERLTAAVVTEGTVAFPLADLGAAPAPVRPRMVQGLLDRLGAGRKDFGAVHIEAILDLKPGGHLDLPSGVGVELRRGTLTFEKRDKHYNPRDIKEDVT